MTDQGSLVTLCIVTNQSSFVALCTVTGEDSLVNYYTVADWPLSVQLLIRAIRSLSVQ